VLTLQSNGDRFWLSSSRVLPRRQDNTAKGRVPGVLMGVETMEANKAIARRALSLIASYEFERALELLSSDAVWSEFGRVHHSKAQLLPDLEFLKSRLDSKGMSMTIRDVIAEGNRVAVTAEENATTTDGKKYSNAFTFWFTVEDGRITAVDQYHDSHMALTTIRAQDGWRDYSGAATEADG
jgi:ketosteroid isomerase-like protein